MVRRRRRRRSSSRKKINFKISKQTQRKIIAFVLFSVVAMIAYQYWKRPESAIQQRPKAVSAAEKKTSVKPPSAKKPPVEPVKPVKPVKPAEPVEPVTYPPISSSRRILSGQPAIAFVLDDIGYTRDHEEDLIALGDEVNYAILPFLKHSGYFGNLSRQTGAQVILHLPLQSVAGVIPGHGLITTAMPEEQILDIVRRDLSTVPNHSGVNNHMGSLGTSDRRVMKIILGELKRRNLFFLDSYTTPKSVALSVGRQIGLPVLKRDIFLDNEDSQPAIRGQVRVLAEAAKHHGYAIGIGHYRYNTFKVLQEEIPKLKRQGFQIVSLSDILDLTGQKR